MGRRKKQERFRFQAGERPNTVTVYEREPGGPIYVSVWDPTARGGKGAQVRQSLKHKDQERAKAYALSQAAKLTEGDQDLRQGTVKLSQVFALYERHRTPKKAPSTQDADRQRMELWARVLGGKTDPLKIGAREWDGFMDARRTGAIDARGNPVAEGERRPVGNRTLEADGRWLHAVLNWASKFRVGGRYLLPENPVRGFMDEDHLPREKNPVNDAITEERHQAMMLRAERVMMEVRWSGKREKHPSWLPELLEIANGTGRRIGAICALRVEDLNLEGTKDCPFGSIDWRADDDKEGYAWKNIPIDGTTRAALERAIQKRSRLGRMGNGPLFPRGTDPEKPIDANIAGRWFRKAEEIQADDLPDLEPMPATRLFHGYRAKWATETKHLPGKDRAEVGGWKSEETIRRVYDKTDRESMLRVVTERGTLREVGS